MKVLITGTTQGIGRSIAIEFLNNNHEVIGIDRQTSSINHSNYTHYQCDIRDYDKLPEINGVNILITAKIVRMTAGLFRQNSIVISSHSVKVFITSSFTCNTALD